MDRLADFIWRHYGAVALIAIMAGLATGLSLRGLPATEIPDWVIRGIAAVETGVHWTDTGVIRGRWQGNDAGDVGPWHISLDALTDLRLAHRAHRIHRDPVYAESVARLWLLRLHRVTGDWPQAVAAWRAGLGGRHRAHARDYAQRAFNYGAAY